MDVFLRKARFRQPVYDGLRMFFADQNRDIHAVGHLFAERAVESVLVSAQLHHARRDDDPPSGEILDDPQRALRADRVGVECVVDDAHARAAGKQLLDMAGANMTVDLPAEILDRTAQNEMKLLKERLSRSGITLEQHCKNSRTTPEALEKDYRAQAESRIRFVLAARAIAEAENIVVHPEEVNAEYRRLSQLQDTPEADIRRVLSPDTLAAALVAQKVQRFLLDNAQVTTVTDAPEKE